LLCAESEAPGLLGDEAVSDAWDAQSRAARGVARRPSEGVEQVRSQHPSITNPEARAGDGPMRDATERLRR
jgi:hypothetical protein